MLLFSAPLYYSFKVKNSLHFIVLVALILLTEYYIYTCLASPGDPWNGIYNIIISLVFWEIFFYKHIAKMFKK